MEQIDKNSINWEKRIISLKDEKKMFEDRLKMATTESGIQILKAKLKE